ncbi:YceI family protein [Nonomuraea cavernae]|uniref:YceI family protein n=1 Tax=Nonomuraea cavernae TaxID=2045107 RepID=UPI001CD96F48|nr:YceI family protein [Nonomuraea cavernae]MCA2187757.1 YceI family protein [Nonomuraea cavernae]
MVLTHCNVPACPAVERLRYWDGSYQEPRSQKELLGSIFPEGIIVNNPEVVQIPGYQVGTWNADPIHSEIGFSVRHMMVSNVRGRFADFEAIVTTAENPLNSTARAAIRVASIDTGHDTRDTDLRSSGFLSVDEYPEMMFTSTAIRMDGDAYLVDGDLTIRGTTKPITLRAETGGIGPDPYGFTRAGFHITTEINRSDFGITGNVLIEGGGVVIADKVKIEIELQMVLQKN